MSKVKLEALISLKNDVGALRKTVKEVQGFKKELKSIKTLFKGGLIGAGAAFGIGKMKNLASLVAQIPKHTVNASIRQERYNKLLKSAFGSQQAATLEMARAKKMAFDYGQNFEVVVKGYARISAAANKSKLEGQGALEMFEAILTAAASEDWADTEFEGILLAFEQMLSGSTVRSQELYIQLAQKMPQALQMFSEVLNVSKGDLKDLIASGTVFSEDVLPAVAARMKEVFGKNIEGGVSGARASLARLQNEVFDVFVTLGEGGFIDAFADAVGEFAMHMKDPAFQAGLRDFSVMLGKLMILSSKGAGLVKWLPAVTAMARIANPQGAVIWDSMTESVSEERERLAVEIKDALDVWTSYKDEIAEIESGLRDGSMEGQGSGVFEAALNQLHQLDFDAKTVYANIIKLREQYNSLGGADVVELGVVSSPGGESSPGGVTDVVKEVDLLNEALINLAHLSSRTSILRADSLTPEIIKRKELNELMHQEAAWLEQSRDALVGKLESEKLTLEEQLSTWKAYEDILLRIAGIKDALATDSFMGDFQASFVEMADSFGTLGGNIGDTFSGTIKAGIESASESLTALLFNTEDFGESAEKIGQSMVSSLIQIGIQELMLFGIQKAISSGRAIVRRGETTAIIAEETSKAPILAVNAAAASVGTAGFSAISGLAFALIGITGIIAALSFREKGGPMSAGEPYIVGEKRAEWFIPSVPGYMMPSVPTNHLQGVEADIQAPVPLYFDSRESAEDYADSVAFETKVMDINERNQHKFTI